MSATLDRCRVVFLKVHVYVGAHFCYRGLALVNKIFGSLLEMVPHF